MMFLFTADMEFFALDFSILVPFLFHMTCDDTLTYYVNALTLQYVIAVWCADSSYG